MCALLTLLLTGPRFGIILWWLISPGRWDRAFNTVILPILGFIFLPWTTLMFVIVAPNGSLSGGDWLWLTLAFVVDIVWTGSLGLGQRRRAIA